MGARMEGWDGVIPLGFIDLMIGIGSNNELLQAPSPDPT